MTVQELRIGNFIDSKVNMRHSIEVKQLFSDSLQAYGHDGKGHGVLMYKSCEGIPLTEEWLLKLGFIKQQIQGAVMCWRTNHFALSFHTDIPDDMYLHGYGLDSQPVKFVHQLQNLYYALTGEELTIKD